MSLPAPRTAAAAIAVTAAAATIAVHRRRRSRAAPVTIEAESGRDIAEAVAREMARAETNHQRHLQEAQKWADERDQAAREMGFADAGAAVAAGRDMNPAEYDALADDDPRYNGPRAEDEDLDARVEREQAELAADDQAEQDATAAGSEPPNEWYRDDQHNNGCSSWDCSGCADEEYDDPRDNAPGDGYEEVTDLAAEYDAQDRDALGDDADLPSTTQDEADQMTIVIAAVGLPPSEPETTAISDAGSAAGVDEKETLWRQLCGVAYTIHVREYGNDGRPEDDLPTTQQQAQADAIAAQLSNVVQIPATTLRFHAAEAAYAYGGDPGTDDDPDRFAPPDWAEVRTAGWPR